MKPKISLSTLLVFVLAYGSQNGSLAEDPEATRVHMKDISKYSDMVLSDMKTTPAIDMGNGMTFTLELEEPSADDTAMNAARKAIGETTEVKEAAKKKLAEILKDDKELNVPWENDAWLIRFLRLRNYDVPKTYKLIKSYYSFKEKNKVIYKDLVPSEEKKIAEQGVAGVLPNRDPAGSRVMLVRAEKWNTKNASLLDLIKVGVIFAERGAYEPATQLAGIQLIFDAEGLTWQHVKQFNPRIAKLIVQWITTSAPVKIQGFHIINQSSTFSSLYDIFKPFLTDELRRKIHLHGTNVNSLYSYIPATSLPDSLGGPGPDPTLSSYEWDVVLRSSDKEYAKLDSYGIKRPNEVTEKQ